MSQVVFLRAVNVGKANRCQPALIAKELSEFGVVNIGAVGTFVVREKVSEVVLRSEIAKQLPFKSEIIIIPGRDLMRLVASDPFARQPSGSNLTRFLSILAKRLPKPPPVPFYLPTQKEWGVKVVSIDSRFVLGLYVREMKAISYLGKLEKQLGVPATTRSWTTIERVAKVLDEG